MFFFVSAFTLWVLPESSLSALGVNLCQKWRLRASDNKFDSDRQTDGQMKIENLFLRLPSYLFLRNHITTMFFKYHHHVMSTLYFICMICTYIDCYPSFLIKNLIFNYSWSYYLSDKRFLQKYNCVLRNIIMRY